MDNDYKKLEQRIEILETRTAFDDLKKMKLSKRTIAAIAFSLILSTFNFFVRNASISLIKRLNFYFIGGSKMDFVTMIRPDFVTIALFLWILGAILKYRTNLENGIIPIILFVVSFVLCTIWGYCTSEYIGNTRLVDAFIMCGLIHGAIVTAIAAYGWDVVNGIKKAKGGTK